MKILILNLNINLDKYEIILVLAFNDLISLIKND